MQGTKTHATPYAIFPLMAGNEGIHPWQVSFTALGRPAPQGSKRHVGHGIMIESSKALAPWRETVAYAALRALNGRSPAPCGLPLAVSVSFTMPRPKSLSAKSDAPAVKRPDIDKLLRAVLDACTGVLYLDDSAITSVTAGKRIARPGEAPGVAIAIKEDA
jgi:crossover junction endodeoxyribonuclease RusA